MPDPELSRHLRAMVWLGWVDLLLGHYREVARRQGRAVELARTSGQLHLLPPLLARNAVTAFERAGTPIETARAELLAGRALAAAGRRNDALAHLDRAREHSAATGARSLHYEITRELRRLGLRHPPRAAPRTAAGSLLEILSPREREIAGLVARGCTNRAIASTLFLSVKTVERHLGRTFTKLDISSRAALAALLAAHAA